MKAPANFVAFYEKFFEGAVKDGLPTEGQAVEEVEKIELELAYVKYSLQFIRKHGKEEFNGLKLSEEETYNTKYAKAIKDAKDVLKKVKDSSKEKHPSSEDIYNTIKRSADSITVVGDELIIDTKDLTYEHDINIGSYQVRIRQGRNRPTIYPITYARDLIGHPCHPHIKESGDVCWGDWINDVDKNIKAGNLLELYYNCLTMVQESYSGTSEYVSKELFIGTICKVSGQEYPKKYGEQLCLGDTREREDRDDETF